MKRKFSIIDLAIFIVIITSVFVLLDFTNLKERNPSAKTLETQVLKERIDTVIIRDSAVLEILTPIHLIRVEIRQYVKFRSFPDTLITVKDTFGNIAIPTFRYRELSDQSQYRLKEIILTHK